MTALRSKHRSPTPSTPSTESSSSSASSALCINATLPASSTMASSSSTKSTATMPSALSISVTKTTNTVVHPNSATTAIPPHAKPKLAIDTHQSLPTSIATAHRSPGCFPIGIWSKKTTKSPVGTAAAAVLSLSPHDPTSPIGSPSHCYLTNKVSSCSVKQLTSPIRNGSVAHLIPAFRKPIVCSQCKASLNIDGGDTDTKRSEAAPTSPCSPPQSPAPATNAAATSTLHSPRCVVCCKARAFEAQLAKAFFSPDRLVDGKSIGYAGLPVECYRQWFKQRPARPDSVTKTETKRIKMLAALQQQHKLHYAKLTDVCTEICRAFDAAACFVCIAADAHVNLVVGNYGSLLHFSCFPREISMCDYTMGDPSRQLCVQSVADDPVFRDNPLLQAVHAQFYLGVPVMANAVAIGAIAVIDTNARVEALDAAALALLARKAALLGKRVEAMLFSDAHRSSSSSSARSLSSRMTMKRQPR